MNCTCKIYPYFKYNTLPYYIMIFFNIRLKNIYLFFSIIPRNYYIDIDKFKKKLFYYIFL